MTVLGRAFKGTGTPESVVRRAESFSLVNHARRTPSAFSGAQNVVATAAEMWSAQIDIRAAREAVTEWEGWHDSRRGPLTRFRLGPRCGVAPVLAPLLRVPFSDNSPFSDSAPFSQGGKRASLLGDVPKNSRAAVLSAPSTAPFWRVGQMFGMGRRLYRITAITRRSPDALAVEFRPPCRVACPAGLELDIDPATEFRLVDEDAGRVAHNFSHYSDARLNAVEVLA